MFSSVQTSETSVKITNLTSNQDVPQTELCTVCSEDFHSKNYECVECSNCLLWCHLQCVDLSKEEYRKISDKDWYCPSCVKQKPVGTFCIPDFIPCKDIKSAVWGNLKGNDISAQIRNAYDKIVAWKKNLFKLPGGKCGKSFVSEVAHLIDLWVDKSTSESVALTAVHVFIPLMLQKPSKKSKNRDHVRYLNERLEKWKKGDLVALINEGEAIQKRLRSYKQTPQEAQKSFVRLMIHGKVSAALKWITEQRSSVLPIDDFILKQLKEKHPEAHQPIPETLIAGIPPVVEPVIFEHITGDTIERAAKMLKGAAGPSNIDSDLWKRILCSKVYGKFSGNACESIARMCRRLCTEYVDPESITALVAGRLIPLDKNPGVRPIGIGECLRRIMGKAVTNFLRPEIIKSVGPLQLAAGMEGGCEAAVHAMNSVFEEDDCQGVIVVDATNAFNSMHRASSLHNIRYICPEFSTYIINTYRQPANLFLPNGSFIKSNEGTTQGDTCASGFYSIGIFPVISGLAKCNIQNCKQIWFADDAACGGRLTALREWWDKLLELGPKFGYHPNAGKTYLIVKNDHLSAAKDIFEGSGIKFTTEGKRYLGAAIGTKSFKEQYVNKKVNTWIDELKNLLEIAKFEPQASYSAFIFGLSKEWLYIMRTMNNIKELFLPLENFIRDNFLTILINQQGFTDTERQIFGLPAKHGGIGIFDPTYICDNEFKNSVQATNPIVAAILDQRVLIPEEEFLACNEAIKAAKATIRSDKAAKYKSRREVLKLQLQPTKQKSFSNLWEKGASSWLTALPLVDFGFVLSKTEFQDALRLRYEIPLLSIPRHCACGQWDSQFYQSCHDMQKRGFRFASA